METINPDLELKTFQVSNNLKSESFLHLILDSLQALIIRSFTEGREGRQKRNLTLKDVNAVCKAGEIPDGITEGIQSQPAVLRPLEF